MAGSRCGLVLGVAFALISGCGSPKVHTASASPPAGYICVRFRSGSDFEQVGRVQRLTVIDQRHFPGTTGFSVTVRTHSKLSLSIAPEADAGAVLVAFKDAIGVDASVEDISLAKSDCVTPN